MNGKNSKTVTFLIIAGVLIAYIMQVSPSVILLELKTELDIKSEVMLNLTVSIIYPVVIITSLLGTLAEKRLGLKKLYALILMLLAVGLAGNLIADSYLTFIILRVIYGAGFGFSIPFYGSMLMKLYGTEERTFMNTVNGLFPFIGTLLCYICINLTVSIAGSWKFAFAIWGFIEIAILISWAPQHLIENEEDNEENSAGVALSVLTLQPIRCLAIIIGCDYFCYSYISLILPTYISESGGISQIAAGILSAIVFPGLGLAGGLVGGALAGKKGYRKTILIVGLIMETGGVAISGMSFGPALIIELIGVAFFGFGNGLWLPAFYMIPCEQKGITASEVSAAFALLVSIGFLLGFISPVIGGIITEHIVRRSGLSMVAAHVLGLRKSLLLFASVNVAGIIAAFRIESK